jgi:hypothetical protein
MELTHKSKAGETTGLTASLKQIIEKKPEGGQILLDEFCRQNTGASRTECVQFLKKSKEGVFITGRRKHPSRFVYGTNASELATPPRAKRQRSTTDQSPDENLQDASVENFQLPIEVKIGDQVHRMPLNIRVSVAA